MNVESAEFGKYANAMLHDLALNALLRLGRPLRTSELISAMGDLDLNRDLLRGGLAGSEVVVPNERRWDLSTRQTTKGKTLDGIVDALLRACNKPLPLQQIAREVGLARQARAEQVVPTLRKFFRDRDRFVELADDVYVLEDWLLDTSADEEQAIIVENRLQEEEGFEQLKQFSFSTAEGDDDEAEWGVKALTQVGRPVSHRVLEFFRWKQFGGDFDPADLLAALHEDARFTLLSGGLVCTAEMSARIKTELTRLAAEAEAAGPAASPVNVEELLSQPPDDEASVQLRPDEVDDVLRHVASSQMPVSVIELVQNMFELSIEDASFTPTLRAVMNALDSDGDFQRVGRDRYLLRQAIPDYVHQLPDSLRPIQLDIRTMQDEPIDLLLDDDGLDGDAALIVHALEWEESGEENEATRNQGVDEGVLELALAVNVLHRRAGTLKLRYKNDAFFPVGASIMRIILQDGDSEFPVWMSRETGIIYDLKDWYAIRQVGVGQIVRLRKTERPDRMRIHFAGEKHPLLALDSARLDQLQQVAEKEDNQQAALLDLLVNLLYDHPRGANLITLWHEVNVIRRTTKRLVASVLSSYHCFYPRRQGDQWFWRLDEDKIDQGFKRNKRKNVRK